MEKVNRGLHARLSGCEVFLDIYGREMAGKNDDVGFAYKYGATTVNLSMMCIPLPITLITFLGLHLKWPSNFPSSSW